MPVISGGVVMPGTRQPVFVDRIGGAALAAGAILAALADNGTDRTITTGIGALDIPRRITATAGGSASADVKAIQVTITGEDPLGNTQTEDLPAFTVNTWGSVTGLKTFRRVTQVAIPAHDGTNVTTSISAAGVPAVADADGIHAGIADNGTDQTITTGISQPDVPRNITATAGGSASADVKAVQVVINGTNIEGASISEALPAFTVNTWGAVAGDKAFASVSSIESPAHDGTNVTVTVGFGDKLGLSKRLSRKTVRAAYNDGVKDATDPTVAIDATAVELNTVDIASALNALPVDVEYVGT